MVNVYMSTLHYSKNKSALAYFACSEGTLAEKRWSGCKQSLKRHKKHKQDMKVRAACTSRATGWPGRASLRTSVRRFLSFV